MHPKSIRFFRLLARGRNGNIISAVVNPLVTLLASILILYVQISRGFSPLGMLPVAVLAVTSLGALAFWSMRLGLEPTAHRDLLIALATGIHALGIAAFAVVVFSIPVVVLGPRSLGIPLSAPSNSSHHWILVAWAAIETVQHFVYKLSFGRRDTLAYILCSRAQADWRRPLGGSVGLQVRKLRRQHRGSEGVVP